mgnify:CR=1 FL=1
MICRPSLCARARAFCSVAENPSLPVPTTSTRGTRKNAPPLITLSDTLNTVPTHRLDVALPLRCKVHFTSQGETGNATLNTVQSVGELAAGTAQAVKSAAAEGLQAVGSTAKTAPNTAGGILGSFASRAKASRADRTSTVNAGDSFEDSLKTVRSSRSSLTVESPPKKEFDSKKRELWGFMGPWQTPEIQTLSSLPIYQRKMARAIYTIHRSER